MKKRISILITISIFINFTILYFNNFIIANILFILFSNIITLIFIIIIIRTENNFFLTLASISIIILLLEVALFIYEKHYNSFKKQYKSSISWIVKDEKLGYKPKKSIEIFESNLINNQPTYLDVKYTIDCKGRKICPPENYIGKRNAIFFGGSFTFGEGLTNKETLPSFFQSFSNGAFKSYNYGFKGWGTAHMYCLLNDANNFADIDKRKKNIAYYCFIDDHIFRNVGRLRYFSTNKYIPYFSLNNGKLQGPFHYYHNDVYIFLLKIYNLKKFSYLLRFLFKPNFIELKSKHEAIKIAAEIIKESRNKFLKLFPNNDFYVILWPRRKLEGADLNLFKSLLNKNQIKFIDIPNIYSPIKSQIHPLDVHPSAFETKYISEYLLKSNY